MLAIEWASIEERVLVDGDIIDGIRVYDRGNGCGVLRDEVGKLGIVGAIEEMVAWLLAEGYLELGHLVAEIILVVIEVLLEEVEEHCDMRATVDIFELVAAELGHDDAILAQVVEDVEQRYADVAGEDAAGQQVVDETCGGGLALGTCDADGHVAVDLKEKVGQRGAFGTAHNTHRNTRGLDDKLVALGGLGGNLLVAIGYGVLCIGHEALDEALSAAALAAVAGDENTLTL